MLFWVDNDTED